jgi:hypothetical protein
VVRDVVVRPDQPVVEGTASAGAKLLHLGGALVEQAARVAEHRPGPQRVEAGLLAGQPAAERLPEPVPSRVDEPELVGDVGDDKLGGVGRGGGAHVGDEVEQRLVLLVADRGDNGRAHHMDGADQRLVRERQQVLDRATTAGDDDHVDLGVALQPRERLHHLGGGALTLHGGVGDLEGDVRPAAPGVVEHVALGGRLRRGDQSDPVGEERQRPLQLGGEQPLGREQLAAPLEPGQQLTEADHPDLADRERERAAVGVVGRLGEHDHAGPLDQGRGQAVDGLARDGQRHRDVGNGVAQRHEDGLEPGPATDLRDLALDPDRTEAVDVLGDQVGDLAHRRGGLRRCLQGHGRRD